MTATTTHLLMMAIGPVQGFIAQARRTRDLWFGSHVLSEIARAAARSIASAQAAILIFPALEPDSPDLLRCDQPYKPDGRPCYSVANKLLALVEGDCRSVAENARAAARDRFIDWGHDVSNRFPALVDRAMAESAAEQLDSFLELHILWLPCDARSPDGYAAAREALEAELLARKSLHAFVPWRAQRGGVHKSSLGGGRESVLLQGTKRQGEVWRRFRIGPGEQLDAIGLLKRAGGEPEHFVPIPNIGLARWIERAEQVTPEALGDLRAWCRDRGFTRIRRKQAWCEAFAHDAQLFLPERWLPYLTENSDESTAARSAELGRRYVEPILGHRHLAPPYPYVACLVADGDHMGDTIASLARRGWPVQRQFSGNLSRFAERAREIIESRYHGVLVYAGGDDVLGFVCVQDALSCADALRRAFAEITGEALDELLEDSGDRRQTPRPTLSVGLGVGHILQSLGTLLELGRAAERAAKHAGRDRLAVVLEKHSGRRRVWTWPWRQHAADPAATAGPVAIMQAAMACLQDGHVSNKKVHEIAALVRRLPAPEQIADSDSGSWARFAVHETRRILARSGLGLETVSQGPLDLTRLGLDDLARHRGSLERVRATLDAWIQRMRIARELAIADRSVMAPDAADLGAAPRDDSSSTLEGNP